VAEGFSLKEIGEHLGRHSAEAARIYANVDLVEFRAQSCPPILFNNFRTFLLSVSGW
jgi:hypothetical protein